jgi:glycosyltransferase involved in cell wall biosynthesis
MEKVSAIIPTCNNENCIEQCLRSVQWADEIIVVDSFSSDKTTEIAAALGARIIKSEYIHSASQKNRAIPQAAHPWIFLLDSDEVCTAELQKEIQALLQNPGIYDGYWIGRRNYFMDKLIRYSGWQNDAVIRFFKRDTCRYEDKHVHAEIISSGKIGRLHNKIIHYTYKGIDHFLEKQNRYATMGAMDRLHKVQHPGLFHIAVKPCFTFFRHYILKLGILDGLHGFIISALSAYTVFLRGVKLWRMKNDTQGFDTPKRK